LAPFHQSVDLQWSGPQAPTKPRPQTLVIPYVTEPGRSQKRHEAQLERRDLRVLLPVPGLSTSFSRVCPAPRPARYSVWPSSASPGDWASNVAISPQSVNTSNGLMI